VVGSIKPLAYVVSALSVESDAGASVLGNIKPLAYVVSASSAESDTGASVLGSIKPLAYVVSAPSAESDAGASVDVCVDLGNVVLDSGAVVVVERGRVWV